MQWQSDPFIWLLLATAVLAAIMAVPAWHRRRPAAGAVPVALLLLAIAWWSIAYILELASSQLADKTFWALVQYLGIVLVPPAWLAFVLDFSGLAHKVTLRVMALASMEPALTLIFAWTTLFNHGLIYRHVYLATVGPRVVLRLDYGPWFYVHIAYAYLALALGSFLLLRMLRRTRGVLRSQAAICLAGALAPWAANLLYVSGRTPFAGLDVTPAAFAVTGVAAAWAMLRLRLFDLLPVAREATFAGLGDGVMVLDAHGRMADINPAGEAMLRATREEVAGQPVVETLHRTITLAPAAEAADQAAAWQAIEAALSAPEERLIEIGLAGERGDVRWCDLRISPLYDGRDRLTGRLLVWRDVTERRMQLLLHAQAEAAVRENEVRRRSEDALRATAQMLTEREAALHEVASALRAAQDGLEQRVAERTAELSQREASLKETASALARANAALSAQEASLRQALQSLQTENEERRRAEAALAERARHLALLNEITRVASGSLDFSDMTQTLADRVGDLIAADNCYITGWDAERSQAVPLAAYGDQRDTYREAQFEPGAKTITQAVLASGRPLIVPDTTDSPYSSAVGTEPAPAQSILGLPLIAGDQKLGALLIGFRQSHDFTEDEVARCEQAASHVALGIAKARLFAAAQRDARELRIAGSTLHALNAAPSVEQAFPAVYDGLCAMTGCRRASVALIDSAHERFTLTTLDLPRSGAAVGSTYALSETAAAEDVLAGRVHLSPDLEAERAFAVERALSEAGHRSRAALPFHAGTEVIGALNLTWDVVEGYRYANLDRVGQVADALALAVERSRLLQETQHLYQTLQEHANALEATVASRTAELTAANQSLVSAAEKLRELDELKTQFVSNVSHELRTPLANIKLYLTLLQAGASEQQQPSLQTLDREVDLLNRLIENLLDLSRLDQGKVHLVPVPVDLNCMAEQLVDDRSALLAQHGLALCLDTAPGLPPVLADPGMLIQVLTNLITNATNYTPRGGKVIVGTRLAGERDSLIDDACVGVFVADTGCGIEADERDRVFERFYRGKAGHESGVPGTGLGLAICDEIVKQHGGHMTVESQVGRGSTFNVWLCPAAPDNKSTY